jgi:uncharacterized protein
VITEAIVLD